MRADIFQITSANRRDEPDDARRRSVDKVRSGTRIVAALVPLLSVAGITGIGFLVSELVAVKNISMLYLAAVVFSALAGGELSAVLAAALSFLAFNYFFIDPRATFTVAHPDELLALVMFVVVALVTGSLAARLRAQAAAAREEARATRDLYLFSRELSGALSLDAVRRLIVTKFAADCGGAALLTPDDNGTLHVAAASDSGTQVAVTGMLAHAQAVYDRRPKSSLDVKSAAPVAPSPFLPLVSGMRPLGLLVIGVGVNRAPRVSPRLEAMVEQAAVAVDRALWARESADAAIERGNQKLQTVLLSSLSHDLKTPLASITGAATSLQQLGSRMDDATRADLLQSIAEDAGRLNRFVGNLFDMTRIESGGLKIRREAIDLAETVERAVRRVRELAPALPIDLKFEAGLPAARGDALLVEQALFNILDNARKYAGDGRPVAVRAYAADGTVGVAVTDSGPGIPAVDIERVFDKFYRRVQGDGRPAGTGLGLSIARGFIAAMGGTIRADSPVLGRRGTRFTITLHAAS